MIRVQKAVKPTLFVALLMKVVYGAVPRVVRGDNLVAWTVRAVPPWILRHVLMAQQQMVTIAPFAWIMLIVNRPLLNVLNGVQHIRMNVSRDVRLSGLMVL